MITMFTPPSKKSIYTTYISGRLRPLFVVGLMICLLAAPVAADGGETFWFILREERVDPTGADIEINRTVQFSNVADSNRTIRVDLDGDNLTNGSSDVSCDAAASSSCDMIMDETNWSVGSHLVEIMENDTPVLTLNINVTSSQHEHEGSSHDSDGDGGGDGDAGHDDDGHSHSHGEESEDSGGHAALPANVVVGLVLLILLGVGWLGFQERKA